MPTPEPVGPHEIGQILGVSRQRVTQLMAGDDFPEPWAELASGRVWRDTDIVQWAESKGRAVQPRT